MKAELDEKLCLAFPNLYVNRHCDESGPRPSIAWGFECGDGWFHIIWELSEKLEAEILKYKESNPDPDNIPRASQVKEKFGGLRFYLDGEHTDEIKRLIEEAEELAWKTCEFCGEPGQRGNVGTWISTLCDPCREEAEEDRAKRFAKK